MACLSNGRSPADQEGISKDLSSDGGFAPHQSLAALRRRSSQMLVALLVLSALCVALLGVSIAALVTAKDAQAATNRQQEATAAGGQVESSADPESSGSSAAGVYASDSPISPEGYLPAGSLYRGSGYWSNSSSNMPAARSNFASVTLAGTPTSDVPTGGAVILMLGGLDGAGAPLASVLSYDAVLDMYNATLAPMPTPRTHLAAAASDADTVVVIGGYKDAASLAAQTPESCVFIYSVSSNVWTSDCSDDAAVGDACAAAIGGTVYVVGGAAVNGQLSSAIRSYNPDTQAWAQVASLPSARAGAACAAVGGLIYIAGGRGAEGALLNEMLSFEAATGTVKALSPLAYGSGDVELVALPGGSLLSIGGIGNTSVAGIQAPTHYVQEYLPSVDAWVQKAPIALARLSAGAAYAVGGVYAFGGLLRCSALAAGGACTERPIADMEVFYDVDHPAVFLHLKDPAAEANSPAPPASKVLLQSSSAAEAGFTSMGLLHAGSGYWAPEAVLPVPALSDHAVVQLGNSLFIIGGMLTANGSINAQMWEFDTLLATYTRRADMPAPRTRAGAAAVDGKIYVTGGFGKNETEGIQGTFVFENETNTWTTLAGQLNVPRTDACMAAIGGNLYIAGGYSADFNETLSSVEVLDTSAGTWTELWRPMPTPRGDVMCSAFFLGGVEHFVVVGGYWDPANEWTNGLFRSEVEAYNTETADWVKLAPMPQARGDNALVTLPGNRMLVLGGETFTDGHHEVASNVADMYLADHDAWVPSAPMPEPRFRFDAAYANGFTYVFGGSTSSVCNPECTVRRGTQTAFKFMDVAQPEVFVFVREE